MEREGLFGEELRVEVRHPAWEGSAVWAELEGGLYVLRVRDCDGEVFEIARGLSASACGALFDVVGIHASEEGDRGFDRGRQFAEQGYVDTEWGEE